ncbi:MAG: hypothetical protein ABI411_16110 [Tahibacter sp.]
MRSIPVGVIIAFATTIAVAAPLPRFPPNAVWHRNISAAPLHTNSQAMIDRVIQLGGWGNGNKFQIDFSILVNYAAAGVATKPTIAWPSADDYYAPDCSAPGLAFPLPPGGAIEGSAGYTCDHENEDCHLIVAQGSKLYEAYVANVTTAGVETQCALVWDLNKVYPPEGRGEQCTSVDAAGFPVAPLLFSADEVYQASLVADSDLGHAIRFVLPTANRPAQGILARVAAGVYVHPGTHAGGPQGPADAIPYAARLRLKSNFNMDNYNAAAKVLLRTMQRYGIVLSDGGNIALTGEDDRFNTHKWADLGITAQVFNPGVGNPAVQVSDFDVLQTGSQIGLTYDCVPVPADFIYIDHFQY